MAASVSVDIFARDRASSTFRRVGDAADDSGTKFHRLGQLAKAGGLAVAAGVGLAGGAVVALGKKAIDIEKEFSLSMAQVAAATGSPAAEMQKLNDLAIKLGADTSFSANDAAAAMLELAKAGLSPATIQAGALQGTLTLAAAGGVDLGTAATVAANALNTFSLKGKDMASVAAALAGGANASSASVESLAQGLSQVGPGATNAGLSLQDTVGVLSAFDAAGIKGSDAGTSLKTMLTRLVPATTRANEAMMDLGIITGNGNSAFLDAHGNFESITHIAGTLQKALHGLSDEQRTQALASIFGSDATRAATVLAKEGADGLAKYIRATKDRGAAEKMAASRTSGTAGSLERLSGSVETAELLIGQKMAPTVIRLANGLGDRLVPATEAAIEMAEGLGRAFKTDGIDGLISKLEELTGTQGELAPIFDEVAGSAEALWDIVQELGPSFLKAVDGAEGLLSPLKLLDDVLSGVANVLDAVPDNIKVLGIQAGLAALVLPRLAGAVTGVTTSVGLNIARLKQFQAELSYTQTRAGAMATAMGKVGGAAKSAAGIAGIMALSSGLGELKDKGTTASGVFKTMAGGAGIGAMFGPIGALVGAGAGGVLGLVVGGFHQTAQEAEKARVELIKTKGFEDAAKNADELQQSLAGVVNAYGQVTRAAIKGSFTGEDGKLESDIQMLKDAGISMSTIVSATMGQADAQGIITDKFKQMTTEGQTAADSYAEQLAVVSEELAVMDAAMAEGRGGIDTSRFHDLQQEALALQDALDAANLDVQEATDNQRVFGEKIGLNTGKIKSHIQQVAQLSTALHISSTRYAQFPKKVRTDFETNGLPQTRADAMRLLGQYKGLQKFKSIKAVISAPGVDLARRQVEKLARQYKLTPHQVKTLLKLEGVAEAVKGSRKVSGEIEKTNKTKYDGKAFATTLHSHMGGFAQDAEQGGRKVADKLKGGTKGAKPDLDDYKRALAAGVNSGQITARQGAIGIGAALKSGLPSGFAGASGLWSGQVAAAVRAAIQAGRNAADAKSPSRKTGLLGKDMAMGLVVGMKGQAGNLGNAGADLIRDLVKGISKGQVSAEKVLGAIDRRVEQTVDRVKGLLSKRGETVSAFQGFATSVFSATPGEGQAMTVDSLLAAQSAERDQAGDVKGAVRRLLGMGMSKSLIAQMQAAGPSGIQQLLTLSNASAAQISLLNNLNKQTQSDYASTGMNVFGATGGAAELAKARADEALAKKIAKELDSLIGNHMANYTFVLHGDTLVATLNRHDRDRGKGGDGKDKKKS